MTSKRHTRKYPLVKYFLEAGNAIMWDADTIFKEWMVCPACGAERYYKSTHPCRRCGHTVMTFGEKLSRDTFRATMALIPRNTGILKRQFENRIVTCSDHAELMREFNAAS